MAYADDTPGQTAQRRALRRHRAGATALLLAMATVYVVASLLQPAGFWIDLVRAGSEAALVGGLADWFAVTALFRRPLGLPIPHTAVIPNSKDRIGQGLGRFIERHFLEPGLVADRLRGAAISRRLGAWLTERANAELVSGRMIVVAGFVFGSLNDQKLRRQVQLVLRRQLREADIAPALAALVDVLRQGGTHHQLFDHVVAAIRHYIDTHRDRIVELVEERSHWWVPGRIDRRVAKAITKGLVDYLDGLSDRDHAARDSFDKSIRRLSADLRESPAWRQRIGEWREQVLASPQVGSSFEALWTAMRESLEAGFAHPQSRLQTPLTGLLQSIGRALAEDPAVQARMDRRVEEMVLALMVPWREDIGRFVADVVGGWDTTTIVDRVELAVGPDLQYIRINGTLVGAVVGCLIYLGTEALR